MNKILNITTLVVILALLALCIAPSLVEKTIDKIPHNQSITVYENGNEIWSYSGECKITQKFKTLKVYDSAYKLIYKITKTKNTVIVIEDLDSTTIGDD